MAKVDLVVDKAIRVEDKPSLNLIKQGFLRNSLFGAIADVIVILDSPTEEPKRSLVSLIGCGKGSFATPMEADEFICRERDSRVL